MNFSPFDEMQKAVDIVHTSPHLHNKISATLFGCDRDKTSYSISATNFWPDSIRDTMGTDRLIGNSSGTVHAETAAILVAPYTNGASLCITDPFCPNCAKNIADAGIKNIYIDHKGFSKDFAERRGSHFESMSMQICEYAGINVYELNRKEQQLTAIFKTPSGFCPPQEENPVEIEPVSGANDETLMALIVLKSEVHARRKFAVALAKNKRGDVFGLTAKSQNMIDIQADDYDQSKYSFTQQAMNRLLMNAPRHGLKICKSLLFCSQIPTAREQVNLIGAGVSNIAVRDLSQGRDDFAFQAMTLLSKNNILSFQNYDDHKIC